MDPPTPIDAPVLLVVVAVALQALRRPVSREGEVIEHGPDASGRVGSGDGDLGHVAVVGGDDAVEDLGEEGEDPVRTVLDGAVGVEDRGVGEERGEAGPVLGVHEPEVAGLELFDLLDVEEALQPIGRVGHRGIFAPDLERLAEALLELKARLGGVDDDVPFILNAKTLADGQSFTFMTTDGPLDVLGMPSGVKGLDELITNVLEFDLGDGLVLLVCDLDDLIRMKRATGRTKDRIELEVLAAVRDERDGSDL
jgi:hypothetical protein